MESKVAEKRVYEAIYELAFDEKAHFFYINDSDTIYSFLKEKFWGDSLEIRVNLLCKLLNYDADVNPKHRKELKKKSTVLKLYLITPPQESNQPF